MKRSEMIDLMEMKFTSCYAWHDISPGEVLDFLELNGMIPPSYFKRISETEANDMGNTKTSYYSRQVKVSDWQPEDDK